MNPEFLKQRLAGIKAKVDAESSTSAYGSGMGNIRASKKTTSGKFAGYNMSTTFKDKSNTGFVGLKNQGATCYLNSFLQTLYLTIDFRKVLYDWDYEKSNKVTEKYCIALQLQKLFSNLQLSKRGCCTTGNITKSFGWELKNSFEQHDIQEMFTVLFDNIKKQEAGSDLARFVETNFWGKTSSYMECKTCNNSRERPDSYLTLNLNVKNLESLEESLKQYIVPEIMDGNNKVRCTPCKSKQPTAMGIKYKSFPYILAIQLKRFEMNWATGVRSKIKTKLTIPKKLNLGALIEQDEKQDDEYELYSILMHTGTATGGHYYCYTKNYTDGKWYIFDDAHVDPITDEHMNNLIDPNFDLDKKIQDVKNSTDLANDERMKVLRQIKRNKTSPLTDAYMLMYRKISDKNINKITNGDVSKVRQEEVKEDNDKYLKDKAEWKRLQNIWKFKARYQDTLYECEAEKVGTLEAALKEAYVELELEKKDIKLEDCRFREWDGIKGLASEPLDGDYLKKTITELGFLSRKTIVFEVRKHGEEFPEWIPAQLHLNLVLLDKDDEYTEPIDIQVIEQGKVSDLRKVVTKHMDVDEKKNEVIIIHMTEETAEVLKDDSQIQRDCKIVELEKIYAELIPISEEKNETIGNKLARHCENSKILKKFELKVNTVEARFNNIGEFEMKNKVPIDIRKSLLDLKTKISEVIGLGLDEFKIRRRAGDPELKNLDKKLTHFGIRFSKDYFIELGKPSKLGDFLYNICLYTPKEDKEDKEEKEDKEPKEPVSPFSYLGRVTLNENMELDQLKDAIKKKFGDKIPALDYFRLREKGEYTLKRVYVKGIPFKKLSLKLKDYNDIAIQEISKPEDLSRDDIVVSARRWYPQEMKLGKPVEKIITKYKTKLDDLRGIFSENDKDLEAKDVKIVVLLQSYKLRDVTNMPKLDWLESKFSKDTVVGRKPLKAKHGEIFLYKDGGVAERKEDVSKMLNPGLYQSAFNREEKAFRILSIEEIEKKEKDLKEKMDKLKQKAKDKGKKIEEMPGPDDITQEQLAAMGPVEKVTYYEIYGVDPDSLLDEGGVPEAPEGMGDLIEENLLDLFPTS